MNGRANVSGMSDGFQGEYGRVEEGLGQPRISEAALSKSDISSQGGAAFEEHY